MIDQTTTYVTCMYNHLHGTIYGGRNRFDMYVESMRSLSMLGANIVCYTSENELEEITRAFERYEVTGITLKTFDLFEQNYHNFIVQMKEDNPKEYIDDFFWQNRNPHIMWGKTRMIMKALESYPSTSNVFWIDAGLSSSSLIRHCYFPNIKTGQYYYSEGLFSKHFTEGIVTASQNRILSILHTAPHNRPIPEYYNRTSYTLHNCSMVGGLFGGNVDKMKSFCNIFDEYIEKMILRREMFSEESIYSGINNDYKELFENFYFDTFYHEDWQDVSIGTQITFSSILEGFL